MAPKTVFVSAKDPKYLALKTAITNADLQKLKSILVQDSTIDIDALHPSYDESEGHTILHLAASNGDVELIDCLLAWGARVDALSRRIDGNCTPLFDAAVRGEVCAAQLLLLAGASVNTRGLLGSTPLHCVLLNKRVVYDSQIQIIKALLDSGSSIDADAPKCGGRVLHQAIRVGHVELIKMLIDRGASLEGSLCAAAEFQKTATVINILLGYGAKDEDMSAYYKAAGSGKMEIVRALRNNTNNAMDPGNSGALHQAALNGHLNIVTRLLNQRFDVNQRDSWRRTPLHFACLGTTRRCSEIVTTLIKEGADTAAKDQVAPTWPFKGGNTPLHCAAWRSDPGVVQALLDAGSEPDGINNDGSTPLLLFASQISLRSNYIWPGSNSRIDSLSLLLAAGADPNRTDVEGRNALHMIAAIRHTDADKNRLRASRLLLARGARKDFLNIHGNEPEDLLSQDDGELRRLLAEP